MYEVYGWPVNPSTICLMYVIKYLKQDCKFVKVSPVWGIFRLIFHYGVWGFFINVFQIPIPVFKSNCGVTANDFYETSLWLCETHNPKLVNEKDDVKEQLNWLYHTDWLQSFFTHIHCDPQLEWQRQMCTRKNNYILSSSYWELEVLSPVMRYPWCYVLVMWDRSGYDNTFFIKSSRAKRISYHDNLRWFVKNFNLRLGESDYLGGDEPNLCDILLSALIAYPSLMKWPVHPMHQYLQSTPNHEKITDWIHRMHDEQHNNIISSIFKELLDGGAKGF